ncbi:MAG: PA14 domain-containing protein [Solirubrobacteraceae bacterium]
MLHRISNFRLPIALCLALAAGLAALTPAARADGLEVQSITPWMQNAAPMGWSSSLNRVFYNVLGNDGMFDGYSANPDGSDPQCLTCTIPSFPAVGTATNRGVNDVSPDGKYMLVTVEDGNDGSQTGAAWTQPGKGGDNDIWLEATDGSQAWPLTNIEAAGSGALGTMWARFDRTGNEIVWSQMIAPAIFNLGYWELKVADIVWSNGVPSLSDTRTIEPTTNSFYEPYGFTPDDQHIIFASDTGMPSWMDSQIDTIDVDGTGLTRLSPADAPTGFFTNYNEFAFYTPDDNWIIYGRTHDATSGGVDYWIMHPDGTDSQRLTWFNSSWSTESLGYTVTGGLVFNPNNPDQFIADVATSSSAENINAMLITLAPQSSTAGLTEQFYTDPNFATPVSTAVDNPSDGFEADASPAAGVPATNYSIRWTGTVTPPQTGTYSFCIVEEYSAQLYVGASELVNASWAFGQRRCSTVQETAGVPTSIRLDYEHGMGTADAQLSWILPGATTPTPIPTADLTPVPGTTSTTTTTTMSTSTTTTSTATSTTTTTSPTTGATTSAGKTSTTTPSATKKTSSASATKKTSSASKSTSKSKNKNKSGSSAATARAAAKKAALKARAAKAAARRRRRRAAARRSQTARA